MVAGETLPGRSTQTPLRITSCACTVPPPRSQTRYPTAAGSSSAPAPHGPSPGSGCAQQSVLGLDSARCSSGLTPGKDASFTRDQGHLESSGCLTLNPDLG